MVPSDSVLFSSSYSQPGPSYIHPNAHINTQHPSRIMAIRDLTPAELLCHPHLRQFLEDQQATAKHLQSMYFKAMNDNVELRQEVSLLRERLEANRPWPTQGFAYPTELKQSIRQPSPSPSLSPSDSISQNGSSEPSSPTQHQLNAPLPTTLPDMPSMRPNSYPISVFWTLKDCQSERGLVTRANAARPGMEKCIRNPDGSRIPRYEWRSIMQAAKTIINADLRPLTAPAGLSTRSQYVKRFPAEWRAAVAKLEAEKPILRLCADHWKADHTLGQVLLSNRTWENRAVRHDQARKCSLGTETTMLVSSSGST